MTHADLVERAARWLKGAGCSIVLTELVTMNSETPDAIGFRASGQESYLVECKSTRGDFLADRRKPFRREGGMGLYRYFLCPPGLIKPADLPQGWGLLYAHPATIEVVAGVRPREAWKTGLEFVHARNHHAETRFLWSALNRIRVSMGDDPFHRLVHTTYAEKKAVAAMAPEVPRAKEPIGNWGGHLID